MITFVCPHCGRKLQIPDRNRGQRGTCNHCAGVITIGAALTPKSPSGGHNKLIGGVLVAGSLLVFIATTVFVVDLVRERGEWRRASITNTIKSYRDYALKYPKGRFADRAEANEAVLRVDQAPFKMALQTGTERSLRKFLADYPGHTSQSTVLRILEDFRNGEDIIDLLENRHLEVEAQGRGIDSVSVRMRKFVTYPLTVRIPAGAFFVSSNSSVQNMVVTANSRWEITDMNWRSESVSAACANRSRKVPGETDTFTVKRSPDQAELAKLMPVLYKAQPTHPTIQAAVWIVTDNADFDELGSYAVRYSGQPIGNRLIHELEAALAMRICDESGIDITRKAVWADRQRIVSRLDPGDLRTWLEQK